jgi:hypothetical protein
MQKWNEFKLNYPKGFYLKEYKGYTFVVFQHPRSGHLNGYVELKPIDEEFLDQNQINKLDCHGGITYQGALDWIFKTPKANYIGFEVWRDEAYVEENCKSLIDQLIEIQKG